MQTFREGGDESVIELTFPDAWAVLKYDDAHASFYQGRIKRLGADLSAVDFVINPHQTPAGALLLLEVKDFRGHEVENRPRLKALATEIVRNVLHTLAALYVGVRAGHQSLQGIAAAVLPAPVDLRVVLLLEEDPLPAVGRGGHMSGRKTVRYQTRLALRGDLQAELVRKLSGFKIKPQVFSCEEIPAKAGWKAVPLPRQRPGI